MLVWITTNKVSGGCKVCLQVQSSMSCDNTTNDHHNKVSEAMLLKLLKQLWTCELTWTTQFGALELWKWRYSSHTSTKVAWSCMCKEKHQDTQGHTSTKILKSYKHEGRMCKERHQDTQVVQAPRYSSHIKVIQHYKNYKTSLFACALRTCAQ